MPRGKKKVEKVEESMESAIRRESTPEEQQIMDEQQRQKRVADCTVAVQQALKESNCDLDITVILRAGQVIPRVSIVPVEVLQAQRSPQNQPM